MATLTILGLGPGSIDDLTRQAYGALEQAERTSTPVFFRTLVHPTVEALRKALPQLSVTSFDRLYDESPDWAELYQQIATTVCEAAARQPVVYAVPGHPLIGESSVQLVLEQARAKDLDVAVISGLSFLEPVCTQLGLDPFDRNMQLVDATNLAMLGSDEIAGKIVPTVPLLVVQLYNRRLASSVKLALAECYPDEWSVMLVRAAGVPGEESVIPMPLYELDRHSYANHLSTLYVPPRDEGSAFRVPETLRYITMRLRRDPDGCPWDRQQTHQSLKRYVLEEAYEVVEALDENDAEKLAEELGDLLLQVYLHAEIARQEEEFSLGDVYEHINAKLIRRHPHVFGSTEVSSAGQVVQNWETIKRQERARAGVDVQNESVLDRVPLASPALVVAQEYQKRAGRTGFDYSTIQEVYDKLEEEIKELRAAVTPEEQREELGDFLYMAARLARAYTVDAEEALRLANRKFRMRFQAMESMAREDGRSLASYSIQEWDVLWSRAKASTKEE